MNNNFEITYTELKNLIVLKNSKWQYVETNDKYILFTVDGGGIVWFTNLRKGIDTSNQTDFENNYKATANQKIDTSVSLSINSTSGDAFGNLRVANPFKVFEHTFLNGDSALMWNTSTATGGTSTFNTNEKSMSYTVTTSNGSSVIRQTRVRLVHQLGTSRRVNVGALIGTGVTNVTKRVGYFDTLDGIFFEQNGSTISVVNRTSQSGSAVDTAVAQSSWNLDKLDGTGPSGVTLDVTKIQMLIFELSYVGGVMYGRLGIREGEQYIFCHEFSGSNVTATVNSTTIHLPIRLEITCTAGSAGATMKHYGAFAMSDGGQVFSGILRTADLGSTGKTVTGSMTPLVALRLKSTNLRGTLRLIGFDFFHGTNNPTWWNLTLNPSSLTGASYASVGADSIAEYDITASAISGGTTIASGYLSGSQQNRVEFDKSLELFLSSNLSSTADILCFAMQKLQGTNPTTYVALRFEEYV